jgi:hypothetical protein
MICSVSHSAPKPSVDLSRGFVFRHCHDSTYQIAAGNLDKYALAAQLEKLLKCRAALQEKKALSKSDAHAIIQDQIENDNLLIKIITEKCMELFDRT